MNRRVVVVLACWLLSNAGLAGAVDPVNCPLFPIDDDGAGTCLFYCDGMLPPNPCAYQEPTLLSGGCNALTWPYGECVGDCLSFAALKEKSLAAATKYPGHGMSLKKVSVDPFVFKNAKAKDKFGNCYPSPHVKGGCLKAKAASADRYFRVFLINLPPDVAKKSEKRYRLVAFELDAGEVPPKFKNVTSAGPATAIAHQSITEDKVFHLKFKIPVDGDMVDEDVLLVLKP